MLTAPEAKIEIRHLHHFSPFIDQGADVIKGLSQQPKTLSPKYFYDQVGSQLFEQICELPEYYLTRTETAILAQAAPEISQITGICELVELGSGSSTKTKLLLSAYEKLSHPWQYVPIDVSSEILQNSASQLHQQYSQLSVLGLVGTYEEALLQLPPSSLSQRMIIFLGSSLGNFSEAESDHLFHQIQNILQSGDYFLLGIDLHKPVAILEAAYNDQQGITAQFNLNMLAHLNWRFQGNFNLESFKHQAIYNQEAQQIEMYLESQQAQQVTLASLNLKVNFRQNESILTEISRKFDLAAMQNFLLKHNLETVKYWTDTQSYFGLILTKLK
jgi:dimethylhistidine N-methyltransferase